MVFYRKYRPQTIKELDSSEVREKLYSVLGSSSVSHAFLFTGPKGLGKTSAARIVAKVLNCEKKKKGIEPCNKCEQCKSITNGTNLDILEIDGASNRGIDEIRDLREKVKLSPMASRKKVYIIDEVHMLTQEAFNALLKTLEEPPPHVVFILCTTEPHKVPATIISRCLHIQFRKAGEEELVRSFERIIKKELIKADKDALNLIASLSDGSFRDGAKLLEEMSLLGGRKKITKDLVEKNYQIAGIAYQVVSTIRNLEDRDTKSALGNVTKIVKDGVEMRYFIQSLIETLHNNLLFKAGIEGDSEFRIENLKLKMQDLKRLIELLSKAHSELKYAVLPQIPLELVIVEWGLQNTQNQVRLGQNTQIVSESDSQKVIGSDSPKIRLSDSQSFPTRLSARQGVPKSAKDNASIASTQQNISTYNSNDALWTALIDKVKTHNHSIAGVLRGCRIKNYDGKNLVIEAKFKFHKDKLSEQKAQDVLEQVCKEITKKKINIGVLLKPA